MQTGRPPAQIVAMPRLPPVDGDRVGAAAAPLRSAVLEITDRVVAVAGEIGRPALAVGEAAAAAEAGAVAAGALAAEVSAGAVVSVAGGKFPDTFQISADV